MYPVLLTIQPAKRVLLTDKCHFPLWEATDDRGDVVLLFSVRGVSIDSWTPRPEDKTEDGWLRGVPDSALGAGRFFPYGPIPEGTRFRVRRPHEVQRVETTTRGGPMGDLGIVEIRPVYVTDQLELERVLHPQVG